MGYNGEKELALRATAMPCAGEVTRLPPKKVATSNSQSSTLLVAVAFIHYVHQLYIIDLGSYLVGCCCRELWLNDCTGAVIVDYPLY